MEHKKMKGNIIIACEFCKGCEFCIEYCPKGAIYITKNVNSKGYNTAGPKEENECNGCALCALMCPEAAIEVWRE
jgi:2-oxoglutarate ferredoxin oxidoreductase subunit delta